MKTEKKERKESATMTVICIAVIVGATLVSVRTVNKFLWH